MMTGMLRAVLPVLLAQVKQVSTEDKRAYAAYIASLCNAYLTDDKELFIVLLDKGSFEPELKQPIVKALFP